MNKRKVGEWLGALVLLAIVLFLVSGLVVSLTCKGIGTAEAAAWVQAIGAIIAVGIAIWLSRDAGVKQRQGPLHSLTAIMDRAEYLFGNIPSRENCRLGGAEAFFEGGTAKAISDVGKALSAFPLNVLQDYAAVQAIFEMQEAIGKLETAVNEFQHMPPHAKQMAILTGLQNITGLQEQVGLAMVCLNAARDGAGIR